jgi:hypothetical protein
MGRAAAVTAVVLSIAAAGCVHSADATGFVFQYGISAFGCDTTCASPGPDSLGTAAVGDTVWLRHQVLLVNTVGDSADATLRPTCTVNVVVQSGISTAQTVPNPTTCAADSTIVQRFPFGGTFTRYTRWVVDSALAPGTYVVVGRILVHPLIEPAAVFTVTP